MSDVSASLTLSMPFSGTTTPAAPAGTSKGLTFSELLSDLNPLQYLPVVGTIYRAVTGDTVPKPLREAGSVVVGGLMGGPVGLVVSLATLAFEKLTGIDFEDLEQRVIASVMPSQPAPAVASAPAVAAAPALASAPAAAPETATQAPGKAWTPNQLIAYGVVTLGDGTLQQGTVSGADVLNELQLQAILKRPSSLEANAGGQRA